MQVIGNILRLGGEIRQLLEGGSGFPVTGNIMFMGNHIEPIVKSHQGFIIALTGNQEGG